jgi:citronellol/citronellal dehydrogenase
LGKLEGKVAIVTGASRGVGRAIALRFAREGAKVVLAAKTVDPNPKLPGTLAEVRRAIEEAGGVALVQPTDVRDEAQIAALMESAVRELGGIDILVNNAGALYWAPVADTPAKRFDLVVGVNVRASFLCAQHALAAMRARGGGTIVNMSPPLTPGVTPGKVAYMISKFGMTMLTEGLAAEGKADGIRVFSLWPVTMVESQAVIGNHLGTPEMWRKADVLVDATLALVTGASNVASGRAVYDEEVLEGIGVTDFSTYACVPGTTPPRMRLDDPTGYWQRGGLG